MKLAVFDIDGTLIDGASTERRFFWALLRHRRLGPRQILAWVGFAVRQFRSAGRNVMRRNKAYLAGHSAPTVEQWAREFVTGLLPGALVTPAVARLRRHQEAGDHVVLLSGTLQPIAQEIGRILGVTDVVATEATLAKGCYTAMPPLRHPFAASKVAAVGQIAARLGVGPESIVAYADSIHDLALLRAVGHRVLVRPDRRLQGIAATEGWETLGSRTQWWQPLANYSRLWTGVLSIRQNPR
jgi:HAD superfamily hydrolase (TIGR01490 family)